MICTTYCFTRQLLYIVVIGLLAVIGMPYNNNVAIGFSDITTILTEICSDVSESDGTKSLIKQSFELNILLQQHADFQRVSCSILVSHFINVQ